MEEAMHLDINRLLLTGQIQGIPYAFTNLLIAISSLFNCFCWEMARDEQK